MRQISKKSGVNNCVITDLKLHFFIATRTARCLAHLNSIGWGTWAIWAAIRNTARNVTWILVLYLQRY